MSTNLLSAHEIVPEASPRVPEVRTSNDTSTAVTHEMHQKVDNLIGQQMIAEPSYHVARAEAGQREDIAHHNSRENAVPVSETSVSTPTERTSSHHYNLDVKQEAGTALRVGAVGAGVAGTTYAALSALSLTVLAGVPSLTTAAAGTAGLVGAGIYGGLAAASLYTGGLLHNVFWNRGGDGARPGVMGTLVRGIVSPITVPAGLLYSWAKK